MSKTNKTKSTPKVTVDIQRLGNQSIFYKITDGVPKAIWRKVLTDENEWNLVHRVFKSGRVILDNEVTPWYDTYGAPDLYVCGPKRDPYGGESVHTYGSPKEREKDIAKFTKLVNEVNAYIGDIVSKEGTMKKSCKSDKMSTKKSTASTKKGAKKTAKYGGK